MRRFVRVVLLILLGAAAGAGAPPSSRPGAEEAGLPGESDPVTGLATYGGCVLEPTPWADGDSFRIRFPGGQCRTIRLYGVDCFETSDGNETDKRRLRAQRRYFGIAKAGGNEQTSVVEAKNLGKRATERVRELLRKPFTVHTAWADGRGDPEFKRYYGFVTEADNRDLGSLLVREGLARAFGVTRARRVGVAQEEYKDRLRDEELSAASKRVGAWQLTNWATLPEERRVERAQEKEEKARAAPLAKKSINPNTAARDELMRLPGIGEVMAIRIMEAREEAPFGKAADLERVPGIGSVRAKALAPYLVFPVPTKKDVR